MNRITVALAALFMFSAPVAQAAQQDTLPVVTIGVVTDGPSPRFADVLDTLKTEIERLLARDMQVRFPPDKELQPGAQLGALEAALDQLIQDPEVDLVVTLGPVISHLAARRAELAKPVVASLIYNPTVQGLPLSDSATTGVPNLNYVAVELQARSIAAMREIAPVARFAYMVPAGLDQALPNLETALEAYPELEGLELDVVPVGETAEPALALLDPAVEGVIVMPLPRIDEAEFQRLADGLIERGLPSFSWIGEREVRAGILAGWLAETFPQRLARRTAINVQRVLLGEDAGTLPIVIVVEERRSLNLETATAINVFPPWEVYVESELIGSLGGPQGPAFSLAGVVEEAIDVNLDLLAEGRFVGAGAETVRLVTSPLLPQAGASLDGRIIDQELAAATPPFLSQRSLSGTAGLSQVVYDQQLWANRSIEKSFQESREFDYTTLELDVALEAVTAYLNVLRGTTFERVQRENLTLTRSNLELAQIRFSVGAADASEVFRWQSEIANDRQILIDAASTTRQARIQLLRVLNRPLDQPFTTVETDLSDPSLVTSETELQAYLENPVSLDRFLQFMAQEALARSPELQSLLALEAARTSAVKASNRAFYIPSLSLDAGVSSFFARGGEQGTLPAGATTLGDTRWQVGLVLSYPIFTGLARSAEQGRAGEALAELQYQIEAAENRIDQRLRTQVYQLGASATNISLSRQSADAAASNYDIVREAYARGVGNIIVLLDAQRAAVVAEQAASTAIYDFLIDLMEVERAVGQYYFFANPTEFQDFLQRLEAFFQNGN